MRFTLDTNVLVYAVDPNAGARRERAIELVTRASHGDCLLILQTLGEFFHAVTRKAMLHVADAVARIEEWESVFPIHAADRTTLHGALRATRDHGLSFWDAMLWATAQQAGCQFLLTEDLQDGRQLGGVTFLNPFLPRNARVIDTTLMPPFDPKELE